MAKKYLLYIHDERFEKEPSKSALVNKLLATHYKPTPYDNMPKIAKFKEKDNKPLLDIPGVGLASDLLEECPGHETKRWNCGRKGCRFR